MINIISKPSILNLFFILILIISAVIFSINLINLEIFEFLALIILDIFIIFYYIKKYFSKLIILEKIFLLILSVIFALFIFESLLVLQQYFHDDRPMPYWGKETDYPINKKNGKSYYQSLQFGGQPVSGDYRAIKMHPNKNAIYDVNYSIGADNFRTTFQPERRNKKINFFGGSFTFGEGVNDNETFPSYFYQLNEDYNVKNYGMHGWGVQDALAVYESEISITGDINFLLTAPWHSLRMKCHRGKSAANKHDYIIDEAEFVVRKPGKHGTCRDLEESRVTEDENKKNSFFDKSKIVGKLSIFFRDSKIQDEEIRLYLSIIEKINYYSNMNNQKFIVGMINAENNFFYSNWNNVKIIKYLRDKNIDVVDMSLENFPHIENVIDPVHEKHPSKLANFRRAKILNNFLNN